MVAVHITTGRIRKLVAVTNFGKFSILFSTAGTVV